MMSVIKLKNILTSVGKTSANDLDIGLRNRLHNSVSSNTNQDEYTSLAALTSKKNLKFNFLNIIYPNRTIKNKCAKDIVTCAEYPFCLHFLTTLADSTINRRVVYEWCLLNIPCPIALDDMMQAQEILRNLLQLRVFPSDLYRCGITSSILCLCGVTIADILFECKYDLCELLDVFEWDYLDLCLLRFELTLLRFRANIPAFAIAKCGVNVYTIFADTHVTYDFLVHDIKLTQEELLVFGFTAQILYSIGMKKDDLIAVCNDSIGLPSHRSAAWYLGVFNFTPSILRAMGVIDENILQMSELNCGV